MRKLLKKLDKIEEYVLIISFPLMLLFVFSATVFRYFQLGSLTWADEASRYLMIWLAYSGVGLGFKKNAHLGLSFFVNRFSKSNQRVLYLIRAIAILVFGGLLTYFTTLILINQVQNAQLSPVMGVPMWLVYLALLFGSILMVVRTLQLLILSLKLKDFDMDGKGEKTI
ncbi:TRAP transporter small permease [Bacillus infantis]|uniref:TRAP transporter small permease n=1 Tax=Bacillus infantis TaxID=324767 RepID=UPI000B9AA849|nr:TRAP transporter small permease [Bacillus infantis]MCK6207054.1 TRAP transporter small permease [Bacillus infantis]OXT15080.1 hypothetical protein B9K06_23015 [Bacillus sp. OG2]